jgi:cell division septum initiation protein DivIVA
MRSELESCQQQNAELQKQVNFLQEEASSAFKAVENSNKAVVRELEEKLHREKQDCQELRKQLLVSVADHAEAVLKFSLVRSYLKQILQLLETVGVGY